MKNREIQKNKWQSFLDDFSRRHLGQPVTLEVLADEQGPQTLAERLPLVGVTLDTKSSEGKLIEIIAGDKAQSNVVHEVAHPSRVRVVRSDSGEDTAVEFESEDQPRTILHMNSPSAPAHLAGGIGG